MLASPSHDVHNLPNITVNQLTSLQDEAVQIKVQGLEPGSRVTLHSYTDTAVPGRAFEAVAVYQADEYGCIDLDRNESLAGSYKGTEPMGLFWSLKPSFGNKYKNARFIKLDVTTPLVVHIRVYSVVIDDIKTIYDVRDELNDKELTSISVHRIYMKPGTERVPLTVEDSGVRGRLFVPPGEGPFPALITMFGGHPGTKDFKASMLSTHGYVSLALAFFGAEGLPSGAWRERGMGHDYYKDVDRTKPDWEWINDSENVPLDMKYFETAIDLLLKHPKVDASRGIAVMSISGSVPIALMLSVHSPHVKAVVCVNGPTYNNFWEFKTDKGTYLPEHMQYDMVKYGKAISRGADIDMRDGVRRFEYATNPYKPRPMESLIPFYERPDCGFLFLTSLDDVNWPSEYHTNQAEKMLKGANHPNYKIQRYAGAGHLLEPPYGAHNETTWYDLIKCNMMWGGSTKLHCKAQEHAWRLQLEFLRKNLSPASKL